MLAFDHWLMVLLPVPGEEFYHEQPNTCPTTPEPEAKAHRGKPQSMVGDSLKALFPVSLSPNVWMKIIAHNSASEENNTETEIVPLMTYLGSELRLSVLISPITTHASQLSYSAFIGGTVSVFQERSISLVRGEGVAM